MKRKVSMTHNGRHSGFSYVTFRPPITESEAFQLPPPKHACLDEDYPLPVDFYTESGTSYLGYRKDFFSSAGSEELFIYVGRVSGLTTNSEISEEAQAMAAQASSDQSWALARP